MKMQIFFATPQFFGFSRLCPHLPRDQGAIVSDMLRNCFQIVS
jgi:hypothetical protein